jgi:hypothetical protein
MRKPTRKNPLRSLKLKEIKEEPIKLEVIEPIKKATPEEKFEEVKPKLKQPTKTKLEPVSDDLPEIIQEEKSEPKIRKKSTWTQRKAEQLKKAREAKKNKKLALNKELEELRAFKANYIEKPLKKEKKEISKPIPKPRKKQVRMTKEMAENQFFNLLDKWEQRKKQRVRPHPNNKRFVKPKPPVQNPFKLYNIKAGKSRRLW